jgi:hypothetical protein
MDHADWAFYLQPCLQSISLELLPLLWSPWFLVTLLVTPSGLGGSAEAGGRLRPAVAEQGDGGHLAVVPTRLGR